MDPNLNLSKPLFVTVDGKGSMPIPRIENVYVCRTYLFGTLVSLVSMLDFRVPELFSHDFGRSVTKNDDQVGLFQSHMTSDPRD